MPAAIDIAGRRRFDFEVLRDMQDARFAVAAYATRRDFDTQSNPVTGTPELASKFRCTLNVPTLKGPGAWSPTTVVGIDTEVADYPRARPRVWLVTQPAPWNPHFLPEPGSAVCIGEEFWGPRQGHVTLGHLVNHLQRILNWDEKGRGPGYTGWNAEALAYHRGEYGSRPLDVNLRYSAMPDWLNPPVLEKPAFEVLDLTGPPASFELLA